MQTERAQYPEVRRVAIELSRDEERAIRRAEDCNALIEEGEVYYAPIHVGSWWAVGVYVYTGDEIAGGIVGGGWTDPHRETATFELVAIL